MRTCALLILLLLPAGGTASEILPPGKYVLGVTITGMESNSVVLSNCSVNRVDDKLTLSIHDRYSEKFTQVSGEIARVEIDEDPRIRISFSLVYHPGGVLRPEKGEYRENYTGIVRRKIGYIGGTVTGQWEDGESFTGKWVLLKVRT